MRSGRRCGACQTNPISGCGFTWPLRSAARCFPRPPTGEPGCRLHWFCWSSGLALLAGAGPWMLENLAPLFNRAASGSGDDFWRQPGAAPGAVVPFRLLRGFLMQVTGLRIISAELKRLNRRVLSGCSDDSKAFKTGVPMFLDRWVGRLPICGFRLQIAATCAVYTACRRRRVWQPHEEIMRYEEIAQVVRVAAQQGLPQCA